MKPEAQRIAIAAAVGTHTVAWDSASPFIGDDTRGTLVTDLAGLRYFVWSHEDGPSGSSTEPGFKPIPRYESDLNAMHEAEKVLTLVQSTIYVNLLWPRGYAPFQAVHATAPQRAEAFLRTLGLWNP